MKNVYLWKVTGTKGRREERSEGEKEREGEDEGEEGRERGVTQACHGRHTSLSPLLPRRERDGRLGLWREGLAGGEAGIRGTYAGVE